MTQYKIVIRSTSADEEPIYNRDTAVNLARITRELLRQCEQEQLIQARLMKGGGSGYTAADVRRLARIRRLQEDLELDLAAVEVVLHLRRQVIDTLRYVEEIERRHQQREEKLLNEIQSLRRKLAEEARWRR